jgi:DNA-binding XRE family transcriptional regulator
VAGKLTQQGLADFCQVDIRTIQRVETGEYNFKLDLLLSICKALGVTPNEIFGKD